MATTPPSMPAALAELHPDVWTAPFWQAARAHRLVAQRCAACGAFRMPPTPFCQQCRSQDDEWVDLPGTGTIYTFNVTHQALIPQLADHVPYVVAVVDLDGAPGARLVTNIVDTDPARVAVGDRVRVDWDDVHAHTTIPRFRKEADGA